MGKESEPTRITYPFVPSASEHSWNNRPIGYSGTRREWDRLVYDHGVTRAQEIALFMSSKEKK